MQLPELDQSWRDEVMTYLVSRYERAALSLRDTQWESFRDFVQIWLDTFDWRTPEGLARYLALPEGQRRDRFARFQRQASSWDVTLQFPIESKSREQREAEARTRRREEHQRARERLEKRAAQTRSRWDAIRSMLEAENALRHLPDHLRESYRFLGLQPQATLADARRRYRELAKKFHPDVSGSHRDMQVLNEHWQRIVAFFLG